MEKIYISGAIEHLDLEERKKTFKSAQMFLENMGCEVINPFDNGLPDDAGWRQHMKVDIKNLLNCDYICMLHGWEKSKGAKLEFDVATSCGIEVNYFDF